jgi:hypothetical protein
MFRPSEEDLQALRVLKRLLQILAGVDTTPASDDDDDPKQTRTQSLATAATGTESTGVIDADDLLLVRKVITKVASSILNRNRLQKTATPQQQQQHYEGILDESDPLAATLSDSRQQRMERLSTIRSQLKEVLPLIRDSTPGLRKISGRFLKKLVDRSVSRITDNITS